MAGRPYTLFRHVGHPLYQTWLSMRKRCFSPNDPDYRLYGGRGIHVCDRWNNFKLFVADMGPKPSPRHSIDRINNDGPYSPENCRWATPHEQSMNKRPSPPRPHKQFTVYGVSHTIEEWANIARCHPGTIHARLRAGWTPAAAVYELPGSKTIYTARK